MSQQEMLEHIDRLEKIIEAYNRPVLISTERRMAQKATLTCSCGATLSAEIPKALGMNIAVNRWQRNGERATCRRCVDQSKAGKESGI